MLQVGAIFGFCFEDLGSTWGNFGAMLRNVWLYFVYLEGTWAPRCSTSRFAIRAKLRLIILHLFYACVSHAR